MSRFARIALGLFGALLLVLGGAAGVLYWKISNPGSGARLDLPATSLSLESPEGAALLYASNSADHEPLVAAFEAQEKGSWCGVASSVIALKAEGVDLTQDGLFEGEAGVVRSWWQTTFGGMPITDLEGLVEAHGVEAEVFHAEEHDVEAFRAEARRNLGTPGDTLIVNYDRSFLGQEGGGHISPVSAISPDDERVLILDTAAYKYPPHWVEVSALHRAMNTPDSESGHSRGWVVVR